MGRPPGRVPFHETKGPSARDIRVALEGAKRLDEIERRHIPSEHLAEVRAIQRRMLDSKNMDLAWRVEETPDGHPIVRASVSPLDEASINAGHVLHDYTIERQPRAVKLIYEKDSRFRGPQDIRKVGSDIILSDNAEIVTWDAKSPDEAGRIFHREVGNLIGRLKQHAE